MQRNVLALLVLATFVFAVGCSGGAATDPNRPATAAATGTVTYKGAPVEAPTWPLFPQGGQGTGANGRTDATGKFAMTTFDPGDGAVPGTYQVTVSKTTAARGEP